MSSTGTILAFNHHQLMPNRYDCMFDCINLRFATESSLSTPSDLFEKRLRSVGVASVTSTFIRPRRISSPRYPISSAQRLRCYGVPTRWIYHSLVTWSLLHRASVPPPSWTSLSITDERLRSVLRISQISSIDQESTQVLMDELADSLEDQVIAKRYFLI